MGKKRRIKEFNFRLQSHIESKNHIKIRREMPEGTHFISGFILDMSKDFLLIQKEEEFYLNGYAIIGNHDFEIRSSESERTFKRILESEGILNQSYGINIEISLASWALIFESLKNENIHVIVHCEKLKGSPFRVGIITKVGKKGVRIREYDDTGTLDTISTKVRYKDITLLKFGERYLNVFKKYLK